MRRAYLLLVVLAMGVACVDLTPPPEVVSYRNGKGGATGPVPGTGGSGGEAVPAGGTGAGGRVGAGGTAGGGGVGIDANPRDVALGNGGVGAGGATNEDTADTGGTTGAGGAEPDVPQGTGGQALDAPVGSGGIGTTDGPPGKGGQAGGTSSAGGVTGAGGITGRGGTTTGSGGATVGSGGATTGSGGSTAVPTAYDCASPIVPVNGLVTASADWNTTTSRWGSGGTLIGNTFQYSGGNASITAKVGGSPVGLNFTGSVPANGGYAGGGLTFFSCVTTASFTKILFDVSGSASNCNIELQLQTYDQRPMEQSPPGACRGDGGACFNFPRKSQVSGVPATNVSVALSGLTNWSAAAGAQIVGVQWQFTSSGSNTCTPNATFTNVKFQ